MLTSYCLTMQLGQIGVGVGLTGEDPKVRYPKGPGLFTTGRKKMERKRQGVLDKA